MSHTMNIALELKDMDALKAACDRIPGCTMPDTIGEYRLFESKLEVGRAVYLPTWELPVVVKRDGSVAYDNYGGRWGDLSRLHELKAYYGLEKAKIEARRNGYSVWEEVDEQRQELVLRIEV